MQFDENFGTTKGHIFGTTIIPLVSATALVTGIKTDKTLEDAHQILGHPGKDLVNGTSNCLGWKLIGEDKGVPCEECMIVKA